MKQEGVEKRRRQLEMKLQEHDISFSWDFPHYICRDFLNHGKGDLEVLMEKMLEIQFLEDNTNYDDYKNDLIEHHIRKFNYRWLSYITNDAMDRIERCAREMALEEYKETHENWDGIPYSLRI